MFKKVQFGLQNCQVSWNYHSSYCNNIGIDLVNDFFVFWSVGFVCYDFDCCYSKFVYKNHLLSLL